MPTTLRIMSFSLNRSLAVALAGLGLLLSGGCSSMSGSSTGSSKSVEQRRASSPISHDDYKKIGYALDWVGYPALSRGASIIDIKAYDDVVVALESGSRCTALDADTGRQRWSYELATPLTRFVGISRDGARILVTSDTEVFGLNVATGNPILRHRLHHVVNTAPLMLPDAAAYGTATGNLFAHQFVQNITQWANATSDSISADLVLINNGIVGAVSDTGEVIFVDAASGSLLGQNRIYDGLDTTPVVQGKMMIVASRDQSLYAFDASQGGKTVWRYRTSNPLTHQPVVHNRVVYVATEDAGLIAIEIGKKKPSWAAPDVMGTVLGMRNGYLMVFGDGKLTTLDPRRGDIISQIDVPHLSMAFMTDYDDGDLITVSFKGVVARFKAR